jgi:acyl-CoA oxidase
MKIFHVTLNTQFYNFFASAAFGEQTPELAEMGTEIHALSCAGKSVVSWLARDAIQEAREACGGHGYLKASRLGDLRDDHDPNCTYEGDNNVLLQSTANFLVKLLEDKLRDKKPIRTQLRICDYLDEMDSILGSKGFDANPEDISHVIRIYHYIVCHFLRISHQKLVRLREKTGDLFVAKNETQVYYLRPLTVTFFECNAIQRFHDFIESESQGISEPLVRVLKRMELLYALFSIQKHLIVLYETGFEAKSFTPTIVGETILGLCRDLKDEAVALVDVFSPPDFVLNSCLGFADGYIYRHIFEAMSKNEGAFDRPEWYREFTQGADLNSKL